MITILNSEAINYKTERGKKNYFLIEIVETVTPHRNQQTVVSQYSMLSPKLINMKMKKQNYLIPPPQQTAISTLFSLTPSGCGTNVNNNLKTAEKLRTLLFHQTHRGDTYGLIQLIARFTFIFILFKCKYVLTPFQILTAQNSKFYNLLGD